MGAGLAPAGDRGLPQRRAGAAGRVAHVFDGVENDKTRG